LHGTFKFGVFCFDWFCAENRPLIIARENDPIMRACVG